MIVSKPSKANIPPHCSATKVFEVKINSRVIFTQYVWEKSCGHKVGYTLIYFYDLFISHISKLRMICGIVRIVKYWEKNMPQCEIWNNLHFEKLVKFIEIAVSTHEQLMKMITQLVVLTIQLVTKIIQIPTYSSWI